jgi:hypothetical protein
MRDRTSHPRLLRHSSAAKISQYREYAALPLADARYRISVNVRCLSHPMAGQTAPDDYLGLEIWLETTIASDIFSNTSSGSSLLISGRDAQTGGSINSIFIGWPRYGVPNACLARERLSSSLLSRECLSNRAFNSTGSILSSSGRFFENVQPANNRARPSTCASLSSQFHRPKWRQQLADGHISLPHLNISF